MKNSSSLLTLAAALAATTASALEITIDAPGGVGNVVTLTNALARISADASNARLWLEPGVYDLDGIYMTSSSHLTLSSDAPGAMIAGLGDAPGDVILKGGGEAGGHRVLYVKGGGNYGWLTVSNLTVTGGWTTGDGGGICSGDLPTRYVNLVVSNNYAKGTNGGGGGGILRGHAENCLFADNTTGQYGGGMWLNGGFGLLGSFVQGAWNCVFTNNVASSRGGGLYGMGKVIGCSFFGNSVTGDGAGGGGAALVPGTFTWSSFRGTTEVSRCTFSGNTVTKWAYATALYNQSGTRPRLPVSDSVFTANNSNQGGDGVVRGCSLTDCTIAANRRAVSILFDCDLQRCNVLCNTNTSGGEVLFTAASSGSCTNVNTLFKGNVAGNYGGIISSGVSLVNCTVVENDSVNGDNWGFIVRAPSLNCVIAGNRIGIGSRDVRVNFPGGVTSPVSMSNCVVGSADVAEDYGGFTYCRITDRIHLADMAGGDFTPLTKSPACDKALQSGWILGLVGDRDLAGRRRVFGQGLDIGAFECQENSPVTYLILH